MIMLLFADYVASSLSIYIPVVLLYMLTSLGGYSLYCWYYRLRWPGTNVTRDRLNFMWLLLFLIHGGVISYITLVFLVWVDGTTETKEFKKKVLYNSIFKPRFQIADNKREAALRVLENL